MTKFSDDYSYDDINYDYIYISYDLIRFSLPETIFFIKSINFPLIRLLFIIII